MITTCPTSASKAMSKQPSYERINYRLRIAKSIERKMIIESARRLATFSHLVDYSYVGFGSLYFADFVVFHRLLGISDMTSIEKEERDQERFLFNRPFGCVKIEFGDSNSVLPLLPWKKRTIVWLDYDGHLDEEALQDIRILVTSLPSGSLLLCSVNCHPDKQPERNDSSPADSAKISLRDYRHNRLATRLNKERIPAEFRNSNLGNWNLAGLYYRLITDQIQACIQDRNASSDPATKVGFHQILRFHYEDGAKMLTVGGLLVADQELPLFDKCNFENLEFIRRGRLDESAYEIANPCLTPKEIKLLDTYLPLGDGRSLSNDALKMLPSEACQRYSEIYKYYPLLAETDL